MFDFICLSESQPLCGSGLLFISLCRVSLFAVDLSMAISISMAAMALPNFIIIIASQQPKNSLVVGRV